MIVINGNLVLDVIGKKEVWVDGKKVWPEDETDDLESCFANGYWIPEYPWTSFLGWKNNP